MDETTKKKVQIGVLAFNCTVVAVMLGTAFTDWFLKSRILVGMLLGVAIGAAAFFLAKGED